MASNRALQNDAVTKITMREIYRTKPELRRQLLTWIARNPDWLNERLSLSRRIAALSDNNLIGIAYSGMDCDCSSFSSATTVKANVMAVIKWSNDFESGAEGPQSWWLITPEEADDTPYTSRDLALEAFENGHPHFIGELS